MHARRTPLAVALILAIAPSLTGLVISSAGAADQLILGKSLVVKDPKPGVDPTRRGILVFGRELQSPDTLIGDPLANGATVEVIANGAISNSQTYSLPAGAFSPGSWGWKALGNPVIGYTYKDPAGVNGPVKVALIKKAPSGTFLVKVLVKGSLGSITVVPPASGTDGGMRFEISGGDTYCVNFGGPAGGAVKNAPASGIPNKLFKIVGKAAAPTSEAGCPVLTTPPPGGVELQGALPATPGRFNYNLTLGLPGADAACNTFFAGTHACTYTELQAAEAAGDLVGLQDTGSNTVTSFWAIDPLKADLLQCGGNGDPVWTYATAHTSSRGERVPLNNGLGTLGALVTSVQCNISGSSWVGCCL
jgi:hypothetical protein